MMRRPEFLMMRRPCAATAKKGVERPLYYYLFGYFCGFDSLLNYAHLETILLTRLRFSTFLHPKSR
jgi:hypothetical protein